MKTRLMSLRLFILILFLLPYFFSEAQEPAKDMVTRITTPVRLDGKLEEDAWSTAIPYTAFMQVRPIPGSAPSEKTTVKFLYDNENIYVGIKAFDTEPQKLLSNNLLRDKYNNDDGVSLMLDTYNDRSNALLFFTNCLGARFDEEVIGNEGNFNPSYNTFWDVRTSIQDDGYSVEYRIPFSSLRFETKEKLAMSFRVVRQIARKNEFLVFPSSDPNAPNIIWRVNTSREIIFTGLKAKKPVYFIPYASSNFTQSSHLDPATNSYQKEEAYFNRNHFFKGKTGDKILSSLGADLKLGLRKNFTLDLTVNTDFAQAEVDNRVVNFTRFNVLLPEKRNFFLESANFLSYSFPTGDRVFDSRNIGLSRGLVVPIVAGARLTGKSKGWQVGMLNMQTQGNKEKGLPPENFSVFRFRKELWGNGSFFGGIFTNRLTTNSKAGSNQVAGIDYYQRINNHWSYGANLSASRDVGSKTLLAGTTMYNAFLSKDVDHGFSHYLNLTSSGKDFNPAMGFLYDRGYKEVYLANSYALYLKSKKINTIGFILDHDLKYRNVTTPYYESSLHAFETRLRYKTGFSIFHKISLSRDSVATSWAFSPEINIPTGIFTWITNSIHIESSNTKAFSYILNSNYGLFYGGKKLEISPQVNWSVNKHLHVEGKYSFFSIHFPLSYSTTTAHYLNHLISSSITYAYSTLVSARALLQYDQVSKTIGTNLRVRYNPKEGTDLYIVYTPLYNTDVGRMSPHLPAIENQSLIVKFVKTFNLNR
jgi:hypothetical protein